MQPHAEHQQDDPDLRQFVRQALVGDEARRERAHGNAGEQIAHERREAKAMGECAEQEGERQRRDDCRDQGGGMPHAVPRIQTASPNFS